MNTIDYTSAVHLLQAGAVRSVCLVYVPGQGGGWGISMRYGSTEAAITARRTGQLRTWARMDTAVGQLLKLGIVKFEVDATNYEPEMVRPRRPDRAEAMREIHSRSKTGG